MNSNFFDYGEIDDDTLSLETYLFKLNSIKKLSDIKFIIIKELFCKNWVKGERLLSITNQKGFDRRIRELRDEYGCDIETRVIGNDYCYRLKSDNIKEGNRRNYLNESEKLTLFKKHGYRCQICNIVVDGGIRGLQSDHKIPLSRGGSSDKSNWQPLCNSCNVSKKSACRGCNEDCNKCIWAYPENGKMYVIKLSVDLIDKLNTKFSGNKQMIDRFFIESIKDKL